jgi:hypothetical protein
MTDQRGNWGPSHLGDWLGDNEDLIDRDDEGGDGEPHLLLGRRWNPVTYRCAFCGESFMSRAMIKRHLEHHEQQGAAHPGSDSDELKAA